MAEARDVLVQLDVHQAVFAERMHAPRLGLARLEEAQRLRDRHLIDQHLPRMQRRFGNAVPGLDHGGVRRRGRGRDAGGLAEEFADRDRVGGVVGALVDHLQHVVGPEDRRRHLHAAGAPAIGHRHLAAGERHLIAGDRDRLQDRAADHPLGLLVEIGEIVGGAFIPRPPASARASLRLGELLAQLAQQAEFGLEVDVMRQLEMLDEAGRLHIVGMRHHEFLVLRRRDALPRRVRGRAGVRSTSAIDMVLRSLCPNASP